MAASSTAVTVLTPNGRRQTVKVSPNTLLLQVLEDVCKKHGFNPDDHGLKFQRNVLDLSLQWRFASLPNNAKLEVVTGTRKQAAADSQVRIALQMEDGSRLQDSFSCGQNMWDLLTHFPQIRVSELSDPGSTPVCVYMRDEVTGEEALKRATLKSLGLTGGSAIVSEILPPSSEAPHRFFVKQTNTPEEGDGREAMETVAMSTKPVAREITPRPPPPADPPSQPETPAAEVPVKNTGADRLVETPPPAPVTTTATTTDATNTLPVKQEGEGVPTPQNAVRPKAFPVREMKQEEDGEEAGPSGLGSSQLTSSSSPPSAPFIPFSGGGQRLGGPGMGGTGPSPSSSSSLISLVAAGGPPKAKKAKASHDYNAKRRASANQEDEDFNKRDEYLKPVEREPLIYHLDSGISRHEGGQDLPDEFFEVTMDDVRKRFAQLKSERKVLEEAPLMTKSLREAQMKEKIERYPKVVLRVQFPDRRVLQGFFRPLETVATLRHFVTSHLEDPKLHFYLFISPPKTILDDPSATLFQANLFPAALVHFGCDVKTDCYLQRELLDSSVSALQADESIAGCVPTSPGPSSSSLGPGDLLPPPSPPEPSVGAQDPSTHEQAPKPTRTDPGKVPKWLKLPGKK